MTQNNRTTTILKLIEQAQNAGFIYKQVSLKSEAALAMAKTWEAILKNVPNDRVLDLFLYSCGQQRASGQPIPAHMAACWPKYKEEMARVVQMEERSNVPSKSEASKILAGTYAKIKLEEQRKIHRTIIQNYRNWAHNEHFADPSECACNFEKFPMYVYTNTKTGEHLCLWCLAEKLGLKQE